MIRNVLRRWIGARPGTTVKPTRTKNRVRPQLEAFEDRLVPAVMPGTVDMTALAVQIGARHSGPTTIYLNFEGNKDQGVSAFQSTTGDRNADIHDIMYRVSEIFAPFDVQVRRGNNLISSTNGNTIIHIGDKASNTTTTAGVVNNIAHAYAPWANSDFPGSTLGYTHLPNSNTFDVAYVDPVSGGGGTWTNSVIAQAIAHEAGHTFGLAHVLSAPDPEVMSYNATNVRFVNKTFAITSLNNTGNSLVNDPNLIPRYLEVYAPYPYGPTMNSMATQNSYTYLKAVLGNRTNFGDVLPNVADRTSVDAAHVDLVTLTPPMTLSSSAATSRPGEINYTGDYDVFNFKSTSSRWVSIDVKNLGSLDPVLMVFDDSGQQLRVFNDDTVGRDSRVTFVATAGVNYKLVVGAYGNNSTGHYSLVATAGASLTVSPTQPVTTSPLLRSLTTTFAASSGQGGVGMMQQPVQVVSFVAPQATAASKEASAKETKDLGRYSFRDLRTGGTPSIAAIDKLFSLPAHLIWGE